MSFKDTSPIPQRYCQKYSALKGWVNMAFIILKIYQHVYNIYLEGTVSQNLKIGLIFLNFNYFFIVIFLDFIK